MSASEAAALATGLDTAPDALRGASPGDVTEAVGPTARKLVTIYTDGACVGNPGPGGYGVVLLYQGRRQELSGGFRRTTSNRMEIMAAIEGLRALKEPCAVTVYTDSKYLADSMTQGWAARWRANGWRRNKKDVAVNPDLWGQVLDLCGNHDVTFEWVKGHAGLRENERCDALAESAARSANRSDDVGYGTAAALPNPYVID